MQQHRSTQYKFISWHLHYNMCSNRVTYPYMPNYNLCAWNTKSNRATAIGGINYICWALILPDGRLKTVANVNLWQIAPINLVCMITIMIALDHEISMVSNGKITNKSWINISVHYTLFHTCWETDTQSLEKLNVYNIWHCSSHNFDIRTYVTNMSIT